MARRLVAKVGEYEKDGQTKGEYVKVGVILNGDNGEYILAEPHVDLCGILLKQNALAAKKSQQQRDNVMISVFDDSQQGQQGGYQQQTGGGFQGGKQQGFSQGQQRGGFNPNQGNNF